MIARNRFLLPLHSKQQSLGPGRGRELIIVHVRLAPAYIHVITSLIIMFARGKLETERRCVCIECASIVVAGIRTGLGYSLT